MNFVENDGVMSDIEKIQLFENKKVRTAWDEEKQEWLFSIIDSIGILSDSKDPKQYILKKRARDPELPAKWGTICTPVEMTAPDGKQRNPEGFSENAGVAKEGAEVAKATRKEVEKRIGHSVVSPEKAIDYLKSPEEIPFPEEQKGEEQ